MPGHLDPRRANGPAILIDESLGPMLVLPDASVLQKEADPRAETLGSIKVAGARYGDRRHSVADHRYLANMSIRTLFWARFSKAA